jgi:hypothetical protein
MGICPLRWFGVGLSPDDIKGHGLSIFEGTTNLDHIFVTISEPIIHSVEGRVKIHFAHLAIS